MTGILEAAAYLLIFPGFLFLLCFGLFCEWVDRRVYARLQNRVGPPIFQPFADLIKLMGKEDIIPTNVDRLLFQYMPLIAFASVMTSVVFIPVWGTSAILPLPGNLVVTLYLFSILPLSFFVIGWSSASLYPLVGGFRAATMLFGYEVPFILTCLAPGMLAGSWSVTGIMDYLAVHPASMLVLLPGFAVALVALEAKLERPPFDIPHAETEIVGGVFTEYSGKKLAVMRMTEDIGLVVGASLLAAIFLGGFVLGDQTFVWSGMDWTPFFNFLLYLAKALVIVFLLAMIRTLFARLRIDQMLDFSWKYLAMGGLFQLFIVMVYAGFIGR